MGWLSCAPTCSDPTHWALVSQTKNIVTYWKLSGSVWTPTGYSTTTTVWRHKGLTAAAALAMICNITTDSTQNGFLVDGSTNIRLQRDDGEEYSAIKEVTA